MLEAEKPLLERDTTDVATIQERGGGFTTHPENKDEENLRENLAALMGGEMEERVISVAEGGDEEDNHESRSSLDDTIIDEEGNSGVLSDEELNKKFDEFIKRMKEEITIDARRTLVVV